ncbi:MAG: SgcJ/EcaC family oxidoreductase [Alphaproteobacteria bacterium]|nr:SgcJ/EcaC family oxidoreductase [Alphaproteobacteria bacterium]
MRIAHFTAAIAIAGTAMLLTACGGDTSAGDEAAIRDIQKKWHEAIVAKDATTIAGMYAEDGQLMPPNSPKAVGRDAVEKGWAGIVGLPGLALTFETEKFTFAKSGDLAVAVDTYKFTVGEGAAAQTETGKATVTWAKRDGKWYVLTDMFSSDAPPPAATPVAAPMEVPAVDPAAMAPAGAPAAPAAGTTPAETTAPAAPATTPAAPAPAPTTPPAH